MGKTLYVGQTVYLLDTEDKDKAPIVVDVVEDLGDGKSWPSNGYRVIDDSGKDYIVSYPKSFTKFNILTRADYIEYLEEIKKTLDETIKKSEELIRKLNNKIYYTEKKVEDVKKTCYKYGHEYDEWKEDTWRGVDGPIEIVYNVSKGNYHIREDHGLSRTCKVCGHKEYIKDGEKKNGK